MVVGMRRLIWLAGIAVALWACGGSSATSITAPSGSAVEADACTENCPTASSNNGPFRLELVLPRVEWKSDEPLTGTVILSYAGPTPTKISGSSDFLNFAYAEAGGTHKVGPAGRADCRLYDLDPAVPISNALSKSGGFTDEDPDVAWLRSFLTAPDVRLPAGTWDVTAIGEFTEGEGCSGIRRSMEATVRVTVTD
jgi:hypothetical protein